MNDQRPIDLASPGTRLSVVVPVYNEAEGLGELHRRVTTACRSAGIDSYELVLVNDGSKDRTLERATLLAERDPQVTVIDLARNYGQQIAMTAGLALCRGERALLMDADLQDPPELIAPMMTKMDEGYDVVFGVRTERHGESRLKLATANLYYRLQRKLWEIETVENAGDFRLLSRRAVDILNAMPERVRYMRGMISWIGLRQAPFPYTRERRFTGTTHYPYRKLLRIAIDAITSFSVVPLRMASALGLGFGFLGLLALLFALFSWASGGAVHGWTSVVGFILIIGSVQMFILGIIGEYLGRVFIEVKNRPVFIVKEVIRAGHVTAEAMPDSALRESAARVQGSALSS